MRSAIVGRIGWLGGFLLSAALLLMAGGCVNIDVDASGYNIPGLSDSGERTWSYEASPLGTQEKTTSDGVSVETYTGP